LAKLDLVGFEIASIPGSNSPSANWRVYWEYVKNGVEDPESYRRAKNVELRNPSFALTTALERILKAFQNPIWAEQARERLKQIKILERVSLP